MIIGLLIIGSVLGGIAAAFVAIIGHPIASVAMVYLATGVFSILAISLGCAFRPRKAPAENARNMQVSGTIP